MLNPPSQQLPDPGSPGGPAPVKPPNNDPQSRDSSALLRPLDLTPANTIVKPTNSDPPVPSASVFNIGGQNLTPGGAQITVSNTPLSLLPGGSSVVIGGSKTVALTSYLASTSSGLSLGYVFGTQTLSAGGAAITVDGTTMSLMPGGSSVVVVSGNHTQTEGVSVLLGGSAKNTGSTTGGSSKTKSGSNLQQTGQRSGNGSSTFTGVAWYSRGDDWRWILGTCMAIWVLAIGIV